MKEYDGVPSDGQGFQKELDRDPKDFYSCQIDIDRVPNQVSPHYPALLKRRPPFPIFFQGKESRHLRKRWRRAPLAGIPKGGCKKVLGSFFLQMNALVISGDSQKELMGPLGVLAFAFACL